MGLMSEEAIVLALQNSHGMINIAARELGVRPNLVRYYIKTRPRLQQLVKDEKELALDQAETALFNAIERGEPWAICFFLKTRGKARGYTEKTVIDITTVQPAKALSNMSDEQLLAYEERLRAIASGNLLPEPVDDDFIEGEVVTAESGVLSE